MLIFNLTRVLDLRGIDNPTGFLLRHGFLRKTASNLANDRVLHIKVAHLEKLCRALNCTPNDLFEWRADDKDAIAESHSLKSLQKSKPATPLSQIVKDIPVDKLDRVEDLLNQLKNEPEAN